ncbi:phosphate acetyltransferase [Thiorhodococcus mannitoliphagus]|uniref:Phosphate acetyltransferase n=1 Tax=Thiorhodococcus mannitoliphagus TaxID=329406 RepID=A0A6P1DZX9_9GAMM|nr:phosphate acetyltransferase [Thiorhodococcus mannitoliphagus]NEX22593.1 phosphate acetyltransferase [Thiorhodococcus mannitoliphagus]
MQSIYIAGAGSGSGKSVVVLGIMEMLSAVNRRVGFFRPFAPRGAEPDNLTALIRSRYELPFPPEMLYGCTVETARQLIGSGHYEELLKLIMNKFKMLEERCDIVVCAGTDYNGLIPSLEFGFNADLANNFGCGMVVVVKGFGRSPHEAADSLNIAHELMRERGSDFIATIINGVAPESMDAVEVRAQQLLTETEKIYVFPEQPALGMPTVGEIRQVLNAESLYGEGDAMNQVVTNYKIAAMEIPDFLNYVEDGCLIITPGDRSDIIVTSLAADASSAFPRVAGLLLTGGIRPAEKVQRLIEGLRRTKVAILQVPQDTFTTAMNVNRIEATILPGDDRKIAAALGLFESRVDVEELRGHVAIHHHDRVTPLMFEYELIRRAKARRQRIVLPEGSDERILRAAEILTLRQVADLVLLGDPDKIRRRIGELGLKLDDIQIIDPATSPDRDRYAAVYYELRKHKGISEQMAHDVLEDVSYFGTLMVYVGDADGMVSGAVHTTQHTIRPSFETVKTKPDVKLVSSVFFMCLPDRVLVYGDCAVNPNPSAEELADIAITSAATAASFGIEPRIAMLSYSSGSSGKGADVERVRQAVAIARERSPSLKLEGPIQYDAAVDMEVGRSKMPGSEVAGRATVLIFPDLNTGNNTYKAVQRSAGAVAIGPVLQGLNKPVNDLSRGCTVTDIVNTVAITAIQAQAESDAQHEEVAQ